VAWFTERFGRLYIRVLSYFKRVPKWEELEQLITTHQERFASVWRDLCELSCKQLASWMLDAFISDNIVY
jgi:hypothetical protein